MSVRDEVAKMRAPIVSEETVSRAEVVVDDEALPLDDLGMVVDLIQHSNAPSRKSIGDMKRAGCTRIQVRDVLTFCGSPDRVVNKIMSDLSSYDDGVWSGDA